MTSNLSIDIGGTKIRIVVYDNSFAIIQIVELKTEEYFTSQTLQDLYKLLSSIETLVGDSFTQVGISFNCVIKNNQILHSSLLGGKVNVNLKEACEKYFNFSKFTSDNDVVCMAKAEKLFGKGKEVSCFTLINIGTGIRLANYENSPLTGGSSLAGEVCFKKVYVKEIKKYIETDDLISGKGIKNISKLLLGKEVSAKEAFESGNEGLIAIFSDHLSNLFCDISHFYNPEAIIMAGSLTNSSDYWLDITIEKYHHKIHELFKTNQIVISTLEHPASIGALL